MTELAPASPVLVAVPDVGGVGVGHFMRAVALAQAWNRRAGRSIVVAPPLDDALTALLAQEKIEHVAATGFDATVGALDAIAREQPVTAIAVDGYRFGAPFERALRRTAHALLAFDDGGETGAHDVDILSDATPGVDAAVYDGCAPGAQLLLGPRYAALRREFDPDGDGRDRPLPDSGPIVMFAGGEPLPSVRCWFEAVADGLRSKGFEVRAPGISEPWRAGEVAAVMRSGVLAVSTGGSTSLELCCVGLPNLLVVVAPNQAGLVAGLDSAGAARSLGPIDGIEPEVATAEVVALASDQSARVGMARRGHAVVDGRGAGRLVVAMRAAALQLEPVGPQHSELIWKWANDPDTRAASFSPEPIPQRDHEQWFAARLADPGCRIYLASSRGSAPFGQIRFEPSGRDLVVGVSIASEARGTGFAAALIAAGVARARRELEPDRIVAYVQRQNVRSQRAFLDAGFALDTTGSGPHDSQVFVGGDE